MTPLWQFAALLVVHFVADFMFQTHWQASNKSKDFEALARHVTTYTLGLTVGTTVIFWGWSQAHFLFVAANAALHLGTDYLTSRWSSRLFAKDWHNFFVVIGLDQLIHQLTLAATMWAIFYR